MAGMAGMGGSSTSSTPPKIKGVPTPVASQVLATTDWQGMQIQARTMTPIRFVVFNGAREQTVRPPADSSFHLMIMLSDQHTGEPIPYASVWATITNSQGKLVFDNGQWPMISEYMGPHYGDDVPHLASGRYRLSVLVSPPAYARATEYKGVWLTAHRVDVAFDWNAKTAHATLVGASGENSSGSMAEMTGMKLPAGFKVNGTQATPSVAIATADWQGMKIALRRSASLPFYMSDGNGGTHEVRPPAGAGFYLMAMLNDEHTGQAITYAPVYATIKDAAGKVVVDNERLQPTISAFNGPFYGNNVKLPGPGRYTIALRIDPPRQARHVEYEHVWLTPHTLSETIDWTPAK